MLFNEWIKFIWTYAGPLLVWRIGGLFNSLVNGRCWRDFKNTLFDLVFLIVFSDPMMMPSHECRWKLLMIIKHWFRLWLGAIRQQYISCANVHRDICRHIAPLGHNELTCTNAYSIFHAIIYNIKWQWLHIYRYLHQIIVPPLIAYMYDYILNWPCNSHMRSDGKYEIKLGRCMRTMTESRVGTTASLFNVARRHILYVIDTDDGTWKIIWGKKIVSMPASH